MLSQFEERLSTVPRWNIVRTIRQQNVAEHSFNVALIADWLCDTYFPLSESEKLAVIRNALLHDKSEGFSGDVASPAKGFFNEDLMLRYHAQKGRITRHDPLLSVEHEKIVKLADRIDAAIFMRIEMIMGNKTVVRLYDELIDHIKGLCLSKDMYEDIIKRIEMFDDNQDTIR